MNALCVGSIPTSHPQTHFHAVTEIVRYPAATRKEAGASPVRVSNIQRVGHRLIAWLGTRINQVRVLAC